MQASNSSKTQVLLVEYVARGLVAGGGTMGQGHFSSTRPPVLRNVVSRSGAFKLSDCLNRI